MCTSMCHSSGLSSTSLTGICDFPRVKDGIARTASLVATSSAIRNPLSAEIESPIVKKSRKSDSIVNCLSDIRPPQP